MRVNSLILHDFLTGESVRHRKKFNYYICLATVGEEEKHFCSLHKAKALASKLLKSQDIYGAVFVKCAETGEVFYRFRKSSLKKARYTCWK
jgi:hypothetical protein